MRDGIQDMENRKELIRLINFTFLVELSERFNTEWTHTWIERREEIQGMKMRKKREKK